MTKEQLSEHLENLPLVRAIGEKESIDKTIKSLRDASEVIYLTGVSKATKDEIFAKLEEYQKVSSGYDNLIESVWGVTWQNAAIISRYTDCTPYEIEQLPNTLSL